MRRGSLACVETLRGKYTLPKGSASESPEAGAWICGTWPAPANGPMRQLPRTGRRKRVFRIAAGIPKGLEGPLGGQGGAEPRAAPMVPQSRLARQPPVRTGRAVAERRETADVTLSPRMAITSAPSCATDGSAEASLLANSNSAPKPRQIGHSDFSHLFCYVAWHDKKNRQRERGVIVAITHRYAP